MYILLMNRSFCAFVHLPTVPIEKYRKLKGAINRDGFPSSNEEGIKACLPAGRGGVPYSLALNIHRY
jgi:hypothetical protein